MGNKVKKQVQERPFRILVVAQIYKDYRDMPGIDEDLNCLKRIYAENVDIHKDDFKKKYEIVNFFDKERSFSQLKIFIASGEFDLIHFSLHGIEKVIIFSDKEQIPYEEFKKIFSIKTNIKAVILNICESAGMARQIAQKISWVLGWYQKVILKDATEATDIFYTSLFADNSIEDSFGSVALDESIKPVIYKDSKHYNKSVSDKETDQEKNHNGENQVETSDIERNKITGKKKLSIILISIVLILVLLMVPVNKILNHRSTNNINAGTYSLQITFPPSGSNVERNETLKVDAKLRSETNPWIFILPPGGTKWWPQNVGSLKDGYWEFPVSFGNEIDSGRFRVLAIIIKENIAADMQEWYNSQGTWMKSEPLSDSLVRSFYWYEADSADYYRIQK